MKISVLGHDWEILAVSDKVFDFHNNTEECNIGGMTKFSDKKIYLRKDHVDKLYIGHELTHAFYYYLCLDQLELTQKQNEEVLCDFVGLHGETIVNLTMKILKELT